MKPSVDIWWMLGEAAEPRTAGMTAPGFTSVPPEWRRGRRGRFLSEVAQRYRRTTPHWSARGAARGWRFNLSSGQHLSLTDSGPYLIVAVGQGIPVGIDAERIRPVDEAMATMARLGLSQLVPRLGRMPPQARNRAFVHLWTAFEAFLKLERLPWDAAAARFSACQNEWSFAIDGTARFNAEARLGLAFLPVYAIPGVVLTVAAPAQCPVSADHWMCGQSASLSGKSATSRPGELRDRGNAL